MTGEPGVKKMPGAKEIEVPTLVRRSFPRKGIGQGGTTRKKWVRGIHLKIQLRGRVW